MKPTFRIPFAPALIGAAALLLTACNSDFNITSSSSGVPLAELDYADATPTGISLAGPDKVIVTSGDALTIDVEGDPDVTEGLRFDLDDDSLQIGREGNWRQSGIATIRVTMPTPTRLSMAGSGTIEVDRLGTGEEASVSIAGSGKSNVGRIDADTLEINVAGSGSLKAAGRAETLDLSIAGAGDLDLRQVEVGNADIAIAGSGDAVFASNGKIDASIMGSGTVEVIGNAQCSVSAMGSGELKCNTRTAADSSRDAAPSGGAQAGASEGE